MIYGLGGFWMAPLLLLAGTLGPLALVLGVASFLAPPHAARVVHGVARAGMAGGVAAAGVGAAGTASSLSALNAAMALVDATTAQALWDRGMGEVWVPLASGLALGGAIVVAMRLAVSVGARAEGGWERTRRRA